MANADYEQALRDRGYEIVQSELVVPVQTPGFKFGIRAPVVTGRKQSGAQTLDVQLQTVRTGRSVGLAVVSRIRGAGLRGEGLLAPHGYLRSLLQIVNSGPKATVILLWVFMLSGVIAVMLPGMFLVGLMLSAVRRDAGVRRYDELTAPGARRMRVWGKEPGAASEALPHPVQEALARSPAWFGYCEVKDGELTLDRQFGYGRYDLFRGAIDAAESVSAVLPR